MVKVVIVLLLLVLFLLWGLFALLSFLLGFINFVSFGDNDFQFFLLKSLNIDFLLLLFLLRRFLGGNQTSQIMDQDCAGGDLVLEWLNFFGWEPSLDLILDLLFDSLVLSSLVVLFFSEVVLLSLGPLNVVDQVLFLEVLGLVLLKLLSELSLLSDELINLLFRLVSFFFDNWSKVFLRNLELRIGVYLGLFEFCDFVFNVSPVIVSVVLFILDLTSNFSQLVEFFFLLLEGLAKWQGSVKFLKLSKKSFLLVWLDSLIGKSIFYFINSISDISS